MITLKNVKLHPDISQETNCFSASIYVGKKRAGTVANDGQGASHRYWWEDRDLHQQIEAWVATQTTEFDFEKLDQLIDDLLTQFEVERTLKQWCKKTTWFRLKTDPAGEWRHVKNAPFSPQVKAWLVKTYGDKLGMIINEDMPGAVALEVARANQVNADAIGQ